MKARAYGVGSKVWATAWSWPEIKFWPPVRSAHHRHRLRPGLQFASLASEESELGQGLGRRLGWGQV